MQRLVSSPFFSKLTRSALRVLPALGLALIVGACGGGTTEDSTAITISSITYTPASPTSGVPVAATAAVSISGSAITSSDLSYSWTETSGPSLTLTGASTATVYFTSPTVTSATEVVLQLTVSASTYTASKSVTITVSP